MKFVHLADLHVGKRLCEVSLLKDQEHALNGIAEFVEGHEVDAVLIAGDVYDRSVPGTDAVLLLDRFLTRLLAAGAKVFLIGGNHDSQERLAFGRGAMMSRGLIISGPYAGSVEKYSLGDTDIWLMPHVRPREVEPFFEDMRFDNTHDALQAIIDRESLDPSRKNIILAHQFVTARGQSAERSDSEVDPVGGESGVDADIFDKFDYVALGHLHAAQKCGRETVRYAGSPVKYSFSEARHSKSFVYGEIGETGADIQLIPIPQLHGMRELKGRLEDILQNAAPSDDHVKVTLTDDVPPASPMERLGAYYKNVLRLELELKGHAEDAPAAAQSRAPMEVFAEFYRQMTGAEMTGDMLKMAQEAYQAVQEAEA